MTEKWDGESFRRQMTMQQRNSENYADQHELKLRMKQGSASTSTRDHYQGEADVCAHLSVSASTDSPHRLAAELDRLENRVDDYIEMRRGLDNAEAYRSGFLGRIRQERDKLKTYLDD